MEVIAVIPARYSSSRFPGKLLAKDTGKYLLQHVYERVAASSLLNEVIVAVDDERIGRACDEFGAKWQMTAGTHESGTDRIAEVAGGLDAQIIVNVQGDEPEIDPGHIDQLVDALRQDSWADMATLSAAFLPDEDIHNPNVVKVVVNSQKHALYFSRWPIPYRRDEGEPAARGLYQKHLGLYAYRKAALLRFSQCEPTPLELSERLEQLRALENQMVITVAEVEHPGSGIDTPEQYAEFVNRYKAAPSEISLEEK